MQSTEPRFKTARELLVSAACLLACLTATEALLRTDLAYKTLPLARAYYNYDVTTRLHRLARFKETKGNVDVVFLGSSVVRAGLDPKLFDAEVAKRSGKHLLSFNLGMPTMYPQGARLYMERLWPSEVTPRYVLHGVRPAELIALPSVPAYLQRGFIEPLWMRDTPLTNMQAFLLRKLFILQYRGIMLRAMQALAAGEPVRGPEPGNSRTDARGYREETTTLASTRRFASKNMWQYETAPAPHDFDYAFDQLARIKAACDRMGATYVLVHMPEHPERFGKEQGPLVWRAYQQKVRAWARAHDVAFIDVTDGKFKNFSGDKYYSDYHHLLGKGTRRLTPRVARRFVEVMKRL